jgi:hypothetical protein
VSGWELRALPALSSKTDYSRKAFTSLDLKIMDVVQQKYRTMRNEIYV